MNFTQADKNKLEKCCPLFDIFYFQAGEFATLFVIEPSGTRCHVIRSLSLHARLYAELAERIMDHVPGKNLSDSRSLLSMTLKELYHIASLYQRCYANFWTKPLGFCRYEELAGDCSSLYSANFKQAPASQ